MIRSPLLIVMCVGYFLVLLDVTVVNVALPAIGGTLDTGPAGLQWVVDGYALALAGLLLVGGTVGDVYGHKQVVLTGLVVFGLASLGCGLAPGVGWLVGARFVQGVGAALLLPGTLAIITDAFPDRTDQARAIGVWAGVGSAALPAGPLLGGLLVDWLGWRAVFFLNVPIVLVAAVVAARLVEARPHTGDRRVDWLGAVLGTALLGTVTYAVIEAGAWLLIVAAVLLAAFVAVESAKADPMLPPKLFRRPTFSVANAAAGIMNLCSLGLLFLVTQYLQTVRHHSALAAGLDLLPLFLPLTVLAPLTGRVAGRIGPRWPMVAGLVVAGAGFALLLTLTAGSSYWALLPALLLWGCGLGVLTPAVVAAAVGAARERSGLASAVNNTARQAGGALGIAAYGAVAGSAADARLFVSGMHVAGLVSVVLFLVAALSTALVRMN
ncbi:MFS transporter [Actinophytocola sp.]|uniref:MFS transporter n=1 Tax=Actinophytocola sp. TaxID=1872138 RepID=UPI00389A5D7C